MSVITVNYDNFKNDVLDNDKTVIIDFWAEWCGPCKMISPLVEELSEEIKDVIFCKINVDDEPAIASAYQIVSIPTLIKMRGGKIIDTSVGYAGKETLKQWILK